MNDRRRLFSIDVLRVISSFFVIVQHSISPEWTRLGAELPASAEWRIMNAVFMIARMSVPVFFMASGAVMLCREQKIKHIWTHNIAGSLFYLGTGIPEPKKETLGYRCVRHLSNIGLGVYLLHPLFLQAIIRWFSGWRTIIAACIVWGLSVMICSVLYMNKTVRRVFLHV